MGNREGLSDKYSDQWEMDMLLVAPSVELVLPALHSEDLPHADQIDLLPPELA